MIPLSDSSSSSYSFTDNYSNRFFIEDRSNNEVQRTTLNISPFLLNASEYLKLAVKFPDEGLIKLPISMKVFDELNTAENFETLHISKRRLADITKAAGFLRIEVLYERCEEMVLKNLLKIYSQLAYDPDEEEYYAEMKKYYARVNEWLFSRQNEASFREFFPKKWNALPDWLREALPLAVSYDFSNKFRDSDLLFLSSFENITFLDLTECERLTSKGLQYLQEFPNLTHLILKKTDVDVCDFLKNNLPSNFQIIDISETPFIKNGVCYPISEADSVHIKILPKLPELPETLIIHKRKAPLIRTKSNSQRKKPLKKSASSKEDETDSLTRKERFMKMVSYGGLGSFNVRPSAEKTSPPSEKKASPPSIKIRLPSKKTRPLSQAFKKDS